jgi:glucosamine--fructose-6-phosphate aminotransferase (isomerizing)
MSQMLNDAKEAPDRVRHLLASEGEVYRRLGERLRELRPAMAATIARGSSDHAATYAAYLIPLCTGRVVASIAPSLVTVLDAPLNLRGQLVLPISQSGRSPDIIAAVERAKSSGATIAAIINDVESPVAGMADFLLPQHAGGEGIAATKSVLCTLTAIARLTAEWAEDAALKKGLERLPAALEKAYSAGMKLDEGALRGVTSAYVLSRGLGLSSALETALKLKETCGLHAEGFSTAEVRHGPREIVGGGFLVLALPMPGSGHDDVLAAAEELRAQGARVFTVDAKSVAADLDSRLMPLVTLQMLYPWLERSSRALGHDPDRPKTLKSKVIKTV